MPSSPLYPYTLLRSKRKTLALQITREGEIVVRSPLKLPEEEIRRFVAEKSPWIQKHLEQISARHSQALPPLSPEERVRLGNLALQEIPRRVEYFAPLVGVDYGRITIRAQHTRWGSCSSKGNLNFNLLLMLCPPEVLDYVVVHELCHRLEMNHSPRFWKEVERVLPDYLPCRQWLREEGGPLLDRLK